MPKVLLFSIVVLILATLLILTKNKPSPSDPQTSKTPPPTSNLNLAPSPQDPKTQTIIYPTSEFKQRITKKPFGVYVSPTNSPIQPERFSGYHTGVDVEFKDTQIKVPVFSVCDGELVLSQWISGYGGTAVIRCQNNYYLYGHLNVDSITQKIQISQGDQIAILGQGNTRQTDYERKHLHFGIHKNSLNLKGYVQTQEELQSWIDPLVLFNLSTPSNPKTN